MTRCELDCEFCMEFAEFDCESDRKIAYFRNEFLLLATLGCFREGYCLYMPLEHERSFAVLGEQQLARIETEIEYIRRIIADEFSSYVLLAEHGPGPNDRGASCCDHAHIHLIPVDDPWQVFMKFYNCGGNPEVLDSLPDLSKYKNIPYIYLSCTIGQHLVWENVNVFGRQFVRRVCAELQGIGDLFNWRVHRFEEEMRATCRRMRSRIREELIVAS